MKTILYMAVTANGLVASLTHETPWTESEWESYSSKVKEVGNLIVGKVTYDFMVSDGSYPKLNNPVVICLTSEPSKSSDPNHYFVEDFESAINLLEKLDFDTALVGGGGSCDTSALESGLLDEIYLDVEPIIFGKGIPLFRSTDKNLNLKLLDTKRVGESGIQLHYQVIK